MLNNTSPICLFATTSDSQLEADFDAGAEINYGIDTAGKAQTDGVEDVSVDARIVIGKFNKFAHSPIVLELS